MVKFYFAVTMIWEYTIGLLYQLSSYVASQWATAIQCNFRVFLMFEIIFIFCLLISENPPILLTYWLDKLFCTKIKTHIFLYLQKICLIVTKKSFLHLYMCTIQIMGSIYFGKMILGALSPVYLILWRVLQSIQGAGLYGWFWTKYVFKYFLWLCVEFQYTC